MALGMVTRIHRLIIISECLHSFFGAVQHLCSKKKERCVSVVEKTVHMLAYMLYCIDMY